MMFSGCKDKDEEMGMSYHDNRVNVTLLIGDHDGNLTEKNYEPWRITGGAFEITDFDVTNGQDPNQNLKIGNVHLMDNDHDFCFIVGRKASKEVAATFNKACPPERNTFNHAAGELNFWVKGTLTLVFASGKTYTFPNTYFAQGHAAAVNNWWFGNDAMTNYKDHIIIWDPYAVDAFPIPIYFGDKCFGYISPIEEPDLVFKFVRGDGVLPNPVNAVDLIGVYNRKQ
jgi:hypothetical protein